jgi:hypothetical protein
MQEIIPARHRAHPHVSGNMGESLGGRAVLGSNSRGSNFHSPLEIPVADGGNLDGGNLELHLQEGGNPDSNTLLSDMTTVICLDDYHSLDRNGRKEKGVTALAPEAQNFDLMYEQASGWRGLGGRGGTAGGGRGGNADRRWGRTGPCSRDLLERGRGAGQGPRGTGVACLCMQNGKG